MTKHLVAITKLLQNLQIDLSYQLSVLSELERTTNLHNLDPQIEPEDQYLVIKTLEAIREYHDKIAGLHKSTSPLKMVVTKNHVKGESDEL